MGEGGVTKKITRRPPWTCEEDAILRQQYDKYGGVWKKIAMNISGRSALSCHQRWTNYLQPGIQKGAFTAIEDEIITTKQAELGNKWAEIAKFLPGKTYQAIKNRGKILKRKQTQGFPTGEKRFREEITNEGNMITYAQIAHMVYRYLKDNGFTITEFPFKNEAIQFLSTSPSEKFPGSLYAILNDYATLKEKQSLIENEFGEMLGANKEQQKDCTTVDEICPEAYFPIDASPSVTIVSYGGFLSHGGSFF